jgi:hypothetical protein
VQCGGLETAALNELVWWLPQFLHIQEYFIDMLAQRLDIRRGTDKSLAFPIFRTTKRIFLGWVKEVRTTKS